MQWQLNDYTRPNLLYFYFMKDIGSISLEATNTEEDKEKQSLHERMSKEYKGSVYIEGKV